MKKLMNRAQQYTEETLGKAEKTQLDTQYESLATRADKTKLWTEKILAATNASLQPSPGARLEDFFYDKLQQKRPDRNTNIEELGSHMVEAGNEFGPSTAYGAALIKIGQTQLRLGQAERELITSGSNSFIKPLHTFLEGDMRNITKERKSVEVKRLDLDACKSRLKKAKSAEAQANAEADVRQAQADFDKQVEITKLLLENISTTHANHLQCLREFAEAQSAFYAQSHKVMQDLERELATTTILSSSPAGSTDLNAVPTMKKARVLYDYDAADTSELSLLADEVISVWAVATMDSDWMMAERGGQRGKVPMAYLELFS